MRRRRKSLEKMRDQLEQLAADVAAAEAERHATGMCSFDGCNCRSWTTDRAAAHQRWIAEVNAGRGFPPCPNRCNTGGTPWA